MAAASNLDTPPEPLTGEIIPPSTRKPDRHEGRQAMPGPDVRNLKDARGGTDRAKPGRKTRAEYVAELADQLFGAHELAYMLTGLVSARLTQEQARNLAGPVYDCCVKYGLPIHGVTSPEIKLLCAAGAIYGPMAFNLRIELLQRRSDEAQTANVPGDGAQVFRPDFTQNSRPATPPQAPPEGSEKAVEPMAFGEGAADVMPGE